MSNDSNKLDITDCVHGRLLYNKMITTKDDLLSHSFHCYKVFRTDISKLTILDNDSILKYVAMANGYRDKVINIFDKRPHAGQENLHSSILEEFFYHLFKDIVRKLMNTSKISLLVLSKANSYVSLIFTPKSFRKLFDDPHPYIHTKDQDFILGCSISICTEVQNGDTGKVNRTEQKVVIPAIAIECKTYLERNMLDSCAATARRIKNAMPYCLYIVAAEYMKMDNAFPELTDIDEVFILCKATNSERLKRQKENESPHILSPDLVVELFGMVANHLNRIWWSPEEALIRGRVICRP